MTVVRSNSAWSPQEIKEFLELTTIPLSLSVLDRTGSPVICSLWYLYEDSAIWCATQRGAHIVNFLRADTRCGFEVAPELPPYKGVRGQGDATLLAERGAEILLRLIERYELDPESGFVQWLIARKDNEVAIRIEPTWMTAWDYTARMSEN